MIGQIRIVDSQLTASGPTQPADHVPEEVLARLERVVARLELCAMERDVLIALVAAAISPAAGLDAQLLQNEPVGGGVRMHALARWFGGDGTITTELARALAADGKLARWLLVERVDASPTPFAFERWIAPRSVVAYALDAPTLAPETIRAGGRLVAGSEVTSSLEPDDLSAIGNAIMRGGSLRLVARDLRDLGLGICDALAVLGTRALMVHAPLPIAAIRDALLCDAVLVIEVPPPSDEGPTVELGLHAVLEHARAGAVPVLLIAGASGHAAGIAELELVVSPPAAAARRALWSEALARRGLAAAASTIVDAADAFAIGRGPIERAVTRLAASLRGAPATALAIGTALADETPDAAGSLGAFEPLALGGDPEADWASLLAPEDTLEELQHLYQRCRYRRQVFDDMGLGRLAGARGVVALFYGPPGTGKTLATRMIAARLGWRLLRIDASRLVSKWIGETEKNLRRILDAAEDGRFALLFDEADALFGKRSADNRGGNDRYANMEINYLLQRLDRFDGIAFLTSNHEQSIDEAFRRRLAARIEFPMPDEAIRATLWRSLVPREVVIDRATLARLARSELAGGHIKNAVLRAAFLVAEQGRALRGEDLLRGLELELRAAGKLSGGGPAPRPVVSSLG